MWIFGWLGPLQHGANIGQTQLCLVYSGASHELQSCLLPLVLLGKEISGKLLYLKENWDQVLQLGLREAIVEEDEIDS